MIGIPLLLGADDGMGLFFAVVMGSVAVLFGVLALIWIVKQFMFICRPNELLVFSGRKNRLTSSITLPFIRS